MPSTPIELPTAPRAGCGKQCGAGPDNAPPLLVVRYGAMRWLGEFARRPDFTFQCGGSIVVRTERGTELGQQVSTSCGACSKGVSRERMLEYIDNSGREFYEFRRGQILRNATPEDLLIQAEHDGQAIELRRRCQNAADNLQLEMKVILAERLLGGERLVFYFRAAQRVDFRQLVRDLTAEFNVRIEMRQVNPRDEARLTADHEICGRECCCKAFLRNMRPINMRMAKVQKATLDPTQVSGRCGRLRCCLRFEHEGYEELNRRLPPYGAIVETPHGVGEVVDRQILTQLLLIQVDERRQITVPFEEVTAIRSLPRDTAAPPETNGGNEPGGAENGSD